MFLLTESLDDPDTGDRLLDDDRHLALTLLGIPAGRECLLSHAVGAPDQSGDHA
jgi:hypothetical protein